MEIEIRVNGAARAVREGCTVAALVAVLANGDMLEVVTLVGGG